MADDKNTKTANGLGRRRASMAIRLVPLGEGSEIVLDRAMVVVGRHPACDARLDSLRVSRHHCCMIQEDGKVFVRDLGSTNGIRINSQRVESGRLQPGDELSIAHIRYRLDDGQAFEQTVAASRSPVLPSSIESVNLEEPLTPVVDPTPQPSLPPSSSPPSSALSTFEEEALAAAVRRLLPSAMADKCRIQVIVEVDRERDSADLSGLPLGVAGKSMTGDRVPENVPECPSDSCLL